MSRAALVAAIAVALLSACSTGSTEVTRTSGPTAATGTSGVSAATAATGATAPVPSGCVAPGSIEVPALANVFGAGIDDLPQPAGGGGGVTPVCVAVPPASTSFSVSSAGGEAFFSGTGGPSNGPDGDTVGSYPGGEIEPAGVVSGIVDAGRTGFVAGVFLGEVPPTSPPASLDVADVADLPTLSPELGQLFPVGDGLARDGSPQTFDVPTGATRLYLGIADAFAFVGPPGYWDDNSGTFTLDVRFA